MKKYLKLTINTFLLSIGLSVTLGSFLRIIGPVFHRYQTNQKLHIKNKYEISSKKGIEYTNNYLLGLLKNSNHKNASIKRLEPLIFKWREILKNNPDLDASIFIVFTDEHEYAEINSETLLPAASSIKVPILIVLLSMLDSGEIAWNEELTLTKEVIASGSGWIAYENIGKKFPMFEVASEMIRVSDNTATNLLIQRIGGINLLNSRLKKLGLKNTTVNNYLPDLKGTNITTTKDLSIAMALVDTGYFLNGRSRDIFREIMSTSQTNSLIPKGILKGLGKDTDDIDYSLSVKGYFIYNKTGDIGISYSDTALIQTPNNSRAIASFIVKGPYNDPRSPELIRNLSAELIPFLKKNKTLKKEN